MYIRGDYVPEQYACLLEIREDVLRFAPERGQVTSFERRAFLINELGITKVKRGNKTWVSLLGNSWLPGEVDTAMREIVRRVEKYLERYEERFKEDKAAGRVGWGVGKQRVLRFRDSWFIGQKVLVERLTPAEIQRIYRGQS